MTLIKNQIPLYPLKFKPIYEYKIWGGRNLSQLLSEPLPDDGQIGEAWLLSDRDVHPSRVAEGPLKGLTIAQLMEQYQDHMMGVLARNYEKFPLLLKFLDVHKMLSVQVHPLDRQTDNIPEGGHGKTEAWIVLDAGPESRIYAGLKPGTTEKDLRQALKNESVADFIASFKPKPGEGFFIPGGTVHSLGKDVLVFEIQQNSDITYRLYDWNHIDLKTRKHRALQIEEAISSIDFDQEAEGPVVGKTESTVPVLREKIFDCKYFKLWRIQGELPYIVVNDGKPRILVCVAGRGQLEYKGVNYALEKGEIMLLPAIVGACTFTPSSAVNLFEIALPESDSEVNK